ncbi:hypothetical protein JHK86_028589 [Glycine max]|nr:hypothetical protein JHK86_028589 [Glycine max]
MLLFNAAGVELTKKVLIREVFMLENQIPFHVLEQISGEKIIQSESKGEGLRSNVENFCK